MAYEFDSNDVMAYIHDYCAKNNIYVNVTKLQKLLYCCYGVVLAALDERLTSEHPQAWEHGPVFPRTFNAIKKQKLSSYGIGFETKCPQEALSLIKETIKVFGQYTAGTLSAWTHKPGSPWDLATDGGENLFVRLDDYAIQKYFREHVWKPEESTNGNN